MSAFNDQVFEKKLLGLKDSQESISTLSDWCLQNKQHHKKIVATWLSVLKKVRVENRLTLFYLANDVVQYSKRKNYDFVESWGTALQKATTMVRHDKVIDRIMRIFKIWGERNVYSEEFLTDLRGLLTAKKATPATPQAAAKQPEQQATSGYTPTGEFHQSVLFKRINKCKELEDDTDLKLKVVNDCKLISLNMDAFRAMLKDRKHADGVAGDLDQAVQQVENYTKALEVEILERKAVIDLLQQATKFYENEKSDAKTVFNAYRNFGSRVKSLKRKLDELIPTLSSPVPSPDVNAPSPSPDLDLDLPNDEDLSVKPAPNTERGPSFNQSADVENMPFSSFMGSGSLPFDIQSNLFSDEGSNRANVLGASEGEPEGKPIEVIGRRKGEDNFDITNFLKTLAQGSPSTKKPNSSALIPGLGDPLPVPPPSIPSDYPLASSSSSPSSVPVPPPPMPPMFDTYSQDSRDREDAWNTSLPAKFPTWRDAQNSNWARGDSDAQDGGEWMPALPVPKVPPPPLPQNLETPESPPNFEKESFREPVEYDDSGPARKSQVNTDVDHRSYLSHSPSPKDVDHRVLNNRFKKDVDHRNLISLTGSPRELQPPPLPPNLWGDVDQDYRLPRQQPRPGDIVESVDMEMSDEEEIERQQDKGRSRDQSPSKRTSGGANAQINVESPLKDREESGKPKSPHPSAASKILAQRFNVPPPTTRPPFPPPPPRPLFPDGQFPGNRFDSPGLTGDFGNFNNVNRFSMPPIPPPPALPLSGPPPGMPLRMRHPAMNLLPNILPPNPLLTMQTRSPGPASLAHRSLEMSPPAAVPPPNTQGTPAGMHSSGPEESDSDSIGQYLNMGLSDDEEIKEMVESMDPQLLQEVVDGINIGNGSDKIDLSSFIPNNGDSEENENDWNGQSDFDPTMRGVPMPAGIRPWKPRQGVPGTPPGLVLGLPHPPMSPGAARFRGHPPNWRSPPMHDRGGMSRGRIWNYRQPRGRGSPGPRQPYGGNW